MKKNIILFSLFVNYLFSGSTNHGGSWIENWLYPDTGLFFWAVITFLLVFIVLRWKAWGPLMEALDEKMTKQEKKHKMNIQIIKQNKVRK